MTEFVNGFTTAWGWACYLAGWYVLAVCVYAVPEALRLMKSACHLTVKWTKYRLRCWRNDVKPTI